LTKSRVVSDRQNVGWINDGNGVVLPAELYRRDTQNKTIFGHIFLLISCAHFSWPDSLSQKGAAQNIAAKGEKYICSNNFSRLFSEAFLVAIDWSGDSRGQNRGRKSIASIPKDKRHPTHCFLDDCENVKGDW
jgi:hypothetical protein